MTRQEILLKAVEGKLTWLQAADILRMSPRHLRRIRRRWEKDGKLALIDRRRGTPRRRRISVGVIQKILQLRRDVYSEFSVQHFYDFLISKHGVSISYTWTKVLLQNAGLAEKDAPRGKHRRKRERRPMTGMMVHLDASTHEWVAGQPKQDLMVALDDADGRMLFARFVPQEGTLSTLQAIEGVLNDYGRFCEFYTDRGAHFCRTTTAGKGPDDVQQGQVTQVLNTLGIRQILALSPQARGRSERAFLTIQGRLPQELKIQGIVDYEAANDYLETVFRPDFNKRFTVRPKEEGTAFIPLTGVDLNLLLSAKHQRIVRNDNTVQFETLSLQLPATAQRAHFARCPVLVHQFPDGTLGVSYLSKLIARFNSDGALLQRQIHTTAAA